MTPEPDVPDPIETMLRVNGATTAVHRHPVTPLLTVLREDLGLTGSKEACGRGECGACTVLLDGRPVMSCILPIARAKGHEIETVEGLGAEAEPLRRAFADLGAFQCGFCTPGQITRGVALIRAGVPEDERELRDAISGNICRCTGYVPIVAALQQCRE